MSTPKRRTVFIEGLASSVMTALLGQGMFKDEFVLTDGQTVLTVTQNSGTLPAQDSRILILTDVGARPVSSVTIDRNVTPNTITLPDPGIAGAFIAVLFWP